MGVLEQVMELKGRGTPENEIISKLREQNVSPNAITEALNQAKIKKAVSSEGPKKNVQNEMEPSIMGPEGAEPPPRELPTEGGISDIDLKPIAGQKSSFQQVQRFPASQEISDNREEYIPQPQEEPYMNQNQQYPQGQYMEEYYPQQQDEYYPQQQDEYSATGVNDTDTIIEIAEQVFSEKIKPIQNQVEGLNEFKILAQTKIDNISNRLKRIELSIDRLQSEILEKVGSYGRGLEGVKREMGMVQDSFGKIVNTLVDEKEKRHYKHRTAKAKQTIRKTRPAKKRSKKK